MKRKIHIGNPHRTYAVHSLLMILLLLTGLCLMAGCQNADPAETTAGETVTTAAPVSDTAAPETTGEPDTAAPETAETTETIAETTTVPETTEPLPPSDGIVRIALLSDSHIGKMNLPTMPEDKFDDALKDVNRLFGQTDGIVMIGDLTDRGYDWEYDLYKQILEKNKQPNTVVCSIMGNHGYFRDGVVRFGGESPRFIRECQKAYMDKIGPLDSDTVIGGIHLIGVSPRDSAANYVEATDYIIEHVEAAAKEDPNMPIIVFTHEGFGKMYGNGGGTFKPGLNALMRKYPQMIVCSGHTHFPINDPRMIQQDLVTTVTTSTVSADFWVYNGSAEIQLPDAHTASQGILMTMGADRIVHLQRYDFAHDAPIGQEWVLNIPEIVKSRDTFTYRASDRVAEAAAPVFGPDAPIQVTDITETTAKVTFPIAHVKDQVSDDMVWSYYLRIREVTADANRFTKSFISDYYMGTEKKQSHTIEVGGLQPGREYEVIVTAKSVWEKISEPLTFTFKTEGQFEGYIKSENYALHKTPIASGSGYTSAVDAWGIENLTDGSKLQNPTDDGGTNGWMAQGIATLVPEGDSVWGGVDLGEIRKINEVDLYPRKSGEYFAPDYDIQVSVDGVTYETVKSIRNDDDGKGYVREIHLDQDYEVRYVRAVARRLVEPYEPGCGGYLMQLSEIEVYHSTKADAPANP